MANHRPIVWLKGFKHHIDPSGKLQVFIPGDVIENTSMTQEYVEKLIKDGNCRYFERDRNGTIKPVHDALGNLVPLPIQDENAVAAAAEEVAAHEQLVKEEALLMAIGLNAHRPTEAEATA
jgi:hypothetical protein